MNGREVRVVPEGALARSFFARDPDTVARELLGVDLVVRGDDRLVAATIVEVEAYGGADDPASHAFRGPTARCAVMFGSAGFLYVYRSYGVHWCMNVVTGEDGVASAVLLRAAELTAAPVDDEKDASARWLSGPGNLTRALGVTGADNAVDCCTDGVGRVSFRAGAAKIDRSRVGSSARIGISRERDRLSRYFVEGHPAVSPRRSPRTNCSTRV